MFLVFLCELGHQLAFAACYAHPLRVIVVAHSHIIVAKVRCFLVCAAEAGGVSSGSNVLVRIVRGPLDGASVAAS